MNFRRGFGVTVILASATAMSAYGQTGVPTARLAGGVGQSSTPVPALFGAWAHPGLGFGPSLSGPGPIRNRSRLPSGQSNSDRMVGDYTNPILKPEAAEVVKRFGEFSLSGEVFPTRTTSASRTRCRISSGTSVFDCCSFQTRWSSSTNTTMIFVKCG